MNPTLNDAVKNFQASIDYKKENGYPMSSCKSEDMLLEGYIINESTRLIKVLRSNLNDVEFMKLSSWIEKLLLDKRPESNEPIMVNGVKISIERSFPYCSAPPYELMVHKKSPVKIIHARAEGPGPHMDIYFSDEITIQSTNDSVWHFRLKEREGYTNSSAITVKDAILSAISEVIFEENPGQK